MEGSHTGYGGQSYRLWRAVIQVMEGNFVSQEGGVVVPFDGQCHLEWNSAFNTSDYMAKYSTLYVS